MWIEVRVFSLFSSLRPLSGGLKEFGVTMWCFLVSDTRIGKSVVQVDR